MERRIKGYVCNSKIQYLASVNWNADNLIKVMKSIVYKDFFEALRRYSGFDFQEIIPQFGKYTGGRKNVELRLQLHHAILCSRSHVVSDCRGAFYVYD